MTTILTLLMAVVFLGAVLAILGLFLRKVLGRRGMRGRRGMFGALARCASGRGAGPAAGGLLAGAGWRAMCMAARFMPPAAGRRWLAEAASFLFEIPPPQRGRTIRNYLLTAPSVIAVSWTGALARRIRLTGSGPAARRNNADDPRG